MQWLRIVCLLIFSSLAVAQSITQGQSQYRLLEFKDGLPNPIVAAIAQDRAGYIWVGTKDGLARYDGKVFKVFRHLQGDAQSLPSNFVQSIHIDAKDRIWLGIEGFGLYRFNRDNSSFTAIPLFAGKGSEPVDIWAISSDQTGSIWLGTFGHGLFRIKPDERVQHFMPTPHKTGLPDENVLSLAFDKQGFLWVATSSGLVKWKNEQFIAFNNELLSSKVVLNLMPDAQFGMWLGTNAGLDLVKPDGQVVKPSWRDQLTDSRVMAMLSEKNGVRWFVARNGLNRVSNGVVQAIRSNDKFVSAFQDRSGGFWFAGDQGLLRQPIDWRLFKAYLPDAVNTPTLRNKTPTDYQAQSDGSLLIVGSSGAIDRFWPKTGEVQHLNSQESMLQLQNISSVLVDQSGYIWIGADNGKEQSLIKFNADLSTSQVWHQNSALDAGLLGPIKQIIQTQQGMIWVVYYGGGIQARDPLSGQVLQSVTPASGQGLKYPDPEQLFIGPDKALWLAGGEGLLRWNSQKNVFEAVLGAPQERIYSAHVAANDAVWIGRLGLLEQYHWNSQQLTLRQSVSGDDGLPAVDITGINHDNNAALWLTSSRGLMRYDAGTKRVHLYSINDGLLSQEFIQRPPFIGADGQALVLNSAGLISFMPKQMAGPAPAMHLVLEAVSLRRAEDLFQLDAGQKIVLQPGDRDLTIDALLLNFDDVNAHRFRSKLTGFDPDWVEMGNSGKRVFSSLPAGLYKLEIIASSAQGSWSKPIVLNIEVLPPMWLTWWAFVAYAVIAVLCIALFIWLYRAHLKRTHQKQLEAQQQLLLLKNSEAKSQFLANLGHEIRTPMTGVLGMTELLLAANLPEKTNNQVVAIKKAGEHLLRLMNDALDISKIEAGLLELDCQAFNLQNLMQEVLALLMPLAIQKGLRFELQIDENIASTYVGDSGRIRQILFNLSNNALKFTSQGYVIIKAQKLWPKGLMLSVVDSGPGMDAQQQQKIFQRYIQADGAETAKQFGGSGLGLAISRDLSILMGGDIQVSSEPGCGATFTLNLPLEISTAPVVEEQVRHEQIAVVKINQHILLVEDDETIQLVISQLLQVNGHEVVIAKNALEALSQTTTHSFALIFCDLDLPGMSGFELARVWRSQGLQTPIVALTARTQPETEAQCVEAGMNLFLRKPVNGRQLQEAITSLLS